ncbi:MAG: tryptophan--tRNA ligase, partial [Candidatus Diapherotrites archaeon]|nr:tryptophan--tRNA ligase [Candidatus Diapherotrites archaeon]
NMHLGHLTPFLFTKWLQDKFDVNLYVQITDDEKFVFKPKLSLEDTVTQSRTDIADIIALGFKPENTFIMQDTVYKDTYKKALKWAKHINFSTVKAVFGFENSTNIGSIYYPAVQCVPIMFEKKRCLIPAAIDQDNYWRVARDIAHKIDGGYPKPAAIHSKFVPALQGYDTKMSSSVANTAIYLSDTPAEVKKKINKYAFSGGRATVEEHRKKGCNTNVCVVCSYINLFEMDDEKAKDQIEGAASGKYLSGESKKYLIKLINNFLEKHQATKKKVEKKIDKFILQ